MTCTRADRCEFFFLNLNEASVVSAQNFASGSVSDLKCKEESEINKLSELMLGDVMVTVWIPKNQL